MRHSTALHPDVEASPPPEQTRNHRERRLIPWVLLIALCLGAGIVIALRIEFQLRVVLALVWGLALYVTGLLLGFMFGIPRVIEPARSDEGEPPAEGGSTDSRRDDAKAAALRRSTINSNLVEVSDWLTKIIVGVGLVELKELPRHGESLAAFIANGLMPLASKASAVPVSGAIALYFGVLGFITGYLLTRIFLAVIMNLADRDADRASTEVSLPAGTRVSVSGAIVSLAHEVSDLQNKVVAKTTDGSVAPPHSDRPTDGAAGPEEPQAEDAEHVPSAAASPSPAPPAPASVANLAAPRHTEGLRSVLWVDDRPDRNSTLRDKLVSMGLEVLIATNTAKALDVLSYRPVALVISDLRRKADELRAMPAGIQLLEEVRRRGYPVRFVIYSTSRSVEEFKSRALEEGAELVTSSPTDLLNFISRLFEP